MTENETLMTTLERLPGSPGCFICDNDHSNPRALRLKIMWDEEARAVKIPFTPDATWCGYESVVHGGLIAAIMDEAMAWVIKKRGGEWAFTADYHLRYKRPLEPGRDYVVTARAGDDLSGRKISAQAQTQDSDGRTVASAEAVFLPAAGKARPRT